MIDPFDAYNFRLKVLPPEEDGSVKIVRDEDQANEFMLMVKSIDPKITLKIVNALVENHNQSLLGKIKGEMDKLGAKIISLQKEFNSGRSMTIEEITSKSDKLQQMVDALKIVKEEYDKLNTSKFFVQDKNNGHDSSDES